MVVINTSPGTLDCRILSVFYARDPMIENLPVIVFHGPSTTTNSTQNSSRIQAHIFSIAGYHSFPRLTISPTSPLYSAVHELPPEEQGDEICRGLAICLLKYFSEIPQAVKECLENLASNLGREGSCSSTYDSRHAAYLASNMVRIEDSSVIADHLSNGLAQQCISWADVDVILPRNAITRPGPIDSSSQLEEQATNTPERSVPIDYGKFTELIYSFGMPLFLPTSRLRRAPSRPTAGSNSRILTQEQKSSLRREMNELTATEQSYVLKLNDLATSAAADYCRDETRGSSKNVGGRGASIQQLFPSCLTEIMDINTEFLHSMCDLMREFGEGHPSQRHDGGVRWVPDRDPTGADAFAKIFLQVLPDFKSPYQQYLQASSQFSQILSEHLREGDSPFARAVQQTGEQRLRSWLIEPVQRLPRYSLFIENMVNQLPADHPAMSKFLRAKDLISDICALDQDDSPDNGKTVKAFQGLVANWPDGFVPQGRLVTVADVAELRAPYVVKASTKGEQGLLLLFPDYVVMLRKLPGNSLTARGLLAEIDRPSPIGILSNGQSGPPRFLNFGYYFQLNETWFTESTDGKSVHLAHTGPALNDILHPEKGSQYSTTIRVYLLQGSYEAKAPKWSEEIAKARIQYRFPECMREDEKWALRVLSPHQESLGIVSAIFENDMDTFRAVKRAVQGRIRVLVEQADQTGIEHAWEAEDANVEIRGHILIHPSHRCCFEFKGFGETIRVDNVEMSDFVSVFTKSISNLLRTNHQPKTQHRTAHAFVSANRRIAESMRLETPTEQTSTHSRFKPMSPVKALSSFLGGISRDQSSSIKPPSLGTSVTSQRPAELLSIGQMTSKSHVQPLLRAESNRVQAADIKPTDPSADNIFVQLESTLTTYIVALRSRCGNIVGKVLRNRTNADILAVNELYNILLDDAQQFQTTAEAPIDVLFSAFEKFLNREWKERMGPVLPRPILDRMQILFDTLPSYAIQDPLRALLNEMSPQNQRAFSALIRLLYELLDTSGNDGDRGALTVAFAELMVQEADPHHYISLLDRLVENIDVLFEDTSSLNTNSFSKNSSLQGARTGTTGSLSSTASSLKKRFGFGNLTRENSKTDSESRVGQIIRNLSKKSTAEANSQPSSLSKSFLGRSRSTDNENRRPLLSRPASKDSNQTLSGFAQQARPATAHQDSFSPIGNHDPVRIPTQDHPRRKRRSSLSDLTNLRNSPVPNFASPNRPRKVDIPADAVSPFQTGRRVLRTPSPPKMQRTLNNPHSKIPSPSNLKENMPPAAIDRTYDENVKQAKPMSQSSGFSPSKRALGSSQIPFMKYGVLSPSPAPSLMSSKAPSPQKLRLQSPQKLRERLDREKKAIKEAGPSLQLELLKIGEELAASKPSGSASPPHSKEVVARVNGLETKMAKLLSDLSARSAALQADIDHLVTVSEKKAKNLDDLYREANAENELLYEKFNTELARVLKAVKGGEGGREMSAKLKEAQDEAARLRKENQRLKRENLGLRSQLKGA